MCCDQGIMKCFRQVICRPVTLENFSPHLEKYVGLSLKLLDIASKVWVPLRKLFATPGVPKLVTRLVISIVAWCNSVKLCALAAQAF